MTITLRQLRQNIEADLFGFVEVLQGEIPDWAEKEIGFLYGFGFGAGFGYAFGYGDGAGLGYGFGYGDGSGFGYWIGSGDGGTGCK